MNKQTNPDNTPVLNKDAQKPVIKCIYHKDQVVTNFCVAQNLPLCPVCVAYHLQDNKNQRDQVQIHTYEEVLDKTNGEINDFLKQLKLRKTKLDTMEEGLKDQEKNLKKQLNIAHNKAKVLLDDYFRTLESELSVALQVSRDKFNNEKLKTYEKLQRQAEINVNYGLGLYDSEKSVRSLLTYLHNDQKDNNQTFIKQLGDLQEFKALSVKSDSSKLHEIHVLLSKYVEIKNIPIINNQQQDYLSQQTIQQIPDQNQHLLQQQQQNFTLGGQQQLQQTLVPQQQQHQYLQPQNLALVPQQQQQLFQSQQQQQPIVPAVLYDTPQQIQQVPATIQPPVQYIEQPQQQQVPIHQQQPQYFERQRQQSLVDQQPLLGNAGSRTVVLQSPGPEPVKQPMYSPYQSQDVPIRDHQALRSPYGNDRAYY